MTTTTFVDEETPIVADWLNDVDAVVYGGHAPATTGTDLLRGDGSGGFATPVIGDGLQYAAYTISIKGLTGFETILYENPTTHGVSPVVIGTGLSFSSGTLANTGVTLVSGTAPVVSSGGTTPAISMAAATGSVPGYLTSADWNTFNGKQAAGTYVNSVSGTSPVVSSGGVTPAISIPVATAAVNGYLAATDWVTFNSKQAAGSYVTSVAGTGPIASSGGTTPTVSIAQATTSTSGYLSSTDWNTFNGKAPATSGAAILYGNGSGGFSSVTIGASLQFSGGTLSFTGSAANIDIKDEGTSLTTTPTSIDFVGAGITASAVGNAVTVTVTGGGGSGGTVTTISGVDTNGFAWAISNPTTTPALTLSTSITGLLKGNGTALGAAVSGTDIKTVGGTSIIGAGDIPFPTVVTSVTGTAPVVSSGGTTPAISMAAAAAGTSGYLTSTDWNTFNNKQAAGSYAPATSGTDILIGNGAGGFSPLVIGTGLQYSTSTLSIKGMTGAANLLYENGSGGFSAVTIGTGLSFAAGTLASTVSAGVTSVSGTTPIVSSGGATPAISIPVATAAVSGYLSSTDWTTFNAKGSGTVTAVSGTAPVVSSGGATPAISMAAASGSVNGYLSSTDWTTFNSKQPAGSYLVTGGALGTPLSGTLTNCTGLPYTGLTGTVPTWNQNTTGNAATATNVAYTGLTGTVPTWNQNTSGSAATWTTARLLAGNSVNGSANVPFANAFVISQADGALTGAQNIGLLTTGLVKNTAAAGVGTLSTAALGTDYIKTFQQAYDLVNTSDLATDITTSSGARPFIIAGPTAPTAGGLSFLQINNQTATVGYSSGAIFGFVGCSGATITSALAGNDAVGVTGKAVRDQVSGAVHSRTASATANSILGGLFQTTITNVDTSGGAQVTGIEVDVTNYGEKFPYPEGGIGILINTAADNTSANGYEPYAGIEIKTIGTYGYQRGLNILDTTTYALVVGTHAQRDTPRFAITSSGQLKWGDGTGAADCTLSRSGASAMNLGGTIAAAGFIGNATSATYATNTGADYSYTGTVTGLTVTTTGTVYVSRVGSVVTVDLPGLYGTSDAATMTLTGSTPTAMRPAQDKQVLVGIIDNSVINLGIAVIKTTGTIEFYQNVAGNPFTASGVKGFSNVSFSYTVN